MTTIAYSHRDKTISVDSRITAGDLIVSNDCDKVFRKNGQLFFMCGSRGDCISLIEVYLGAQPSSKEYDASIMTYIDGVAFCFTFCDGKIEQWPLLEDYSIGSGSEFALAAMDFGKSSAEAVKYASTRDCRTGGKVRTFKV